MVEIRTVNVYPLIIAIRRYRLNPTVFFTIIQNFLSHRREEILNAQLAKYCGPYEVELKIEIRPILYQCIEELDLSDNVEDYFIKNSYLFIKDHVTQ